MIALLPIHMTAIMAVFLRPEPENTMHKEKPSCVLNPKEMRRLALAHVQAYVNACHCQSRRDVLMALAHWHDVGVNMSDFIKNTRLIIIDEDGIHER